MPARRRYLGGVGLAAWALLAASAPGVAQNGTWVGEGDRIRLWTVTPFAPGAGPRGSADGRLQRLGPDTLELRLGQVVYAVPRSAITRVELSVGHAHRGRNVGYAFAGTLAAGTLLSGLASSSCRNDAFFGPSFCFAVVEVFVVLPASGLAALIGGVATPEAFRPASLPPPGR